MVSTTVRVAVAVEANEAATSAAVAMRQQARRQHDGMELIEREHDGLWATFGVQAGKGQLLGKV